MTGPDGILIKMALEEQFPDRGTLTVEWQVSEIDGTRRLGWSCSSHPPLDPRLAIGLLTDVAAELEMDLPE